VQHNEDDHSRPATEPGQARVSGLVVTARDREDQINQGEVVDHVKATRNPISPVSELVGSGGAGSSATKTWGTREREGGHVRVCGRGE
jgi:hypothetical protein